MLTLDRVQSLALRRARTASVLVKGASGTGKSTLANAIAVEAASAHLSCLLVGSSRELERPLRYAASSACHPILIQRAQVGYQAVSPRSKIDHIDARGRLDPAAMRLAARTLRRARELIDKYQFQQDEIELGILALHPMRPEGRDLLAVATHDANRIAHVLWSGNRGAGRSLHDVEEVITGRPAGVPPDVGLLDLILADDRSFESRLRALLAATADAEEEKHLSAVLSALRCSTQSDETLKELHDRIVRMTRMLRDAVELVGDRGSLQAAVAIKPPTHASRIVQFFVRDHPGQEAGGAINYLRNLAQQFENDDVALAPFLERHGARTVGSAARTEPKGLCLFPVDRSSIGSVVGKIREARYAARQLPGIMARIRAILPPHLLEEIANVSLEKVAERIETERTPDEREKAAEDLGQLRDLFASTGFGDLFSVPDDFLDRTETLSESATQSGKMPSAELLDLLVDSAAPCASAALTRAEGWPSSVVRARSQSELENIASGNTRFDVLIADDADTFDAAMLERFAQAGTRVHRIGAAASTDAVPLEIPYRQVNFQMADLASGRHGYWLAGPGGLGLVVRHGDGDLDSLTSEAANLAAFLRDLGRSAVVAPVARDIVADIVVAATDELGDEDLQDHATHAREGLVVLCRKDLRRREMASSRRLPADAITAGSLGWQVKRTCAEGVVLEKAGKAVALVDEPVALTSAQETATDVVERLSSLGWRPIVAWRDAPRDPETLERLLHEHAVPVGLEETLRALVERFDAPEVDPRSVNVADGPAASDLRDAPRNPPALTPLQGETVAGPARNSAIADPLPLLQTRDFKLAEQPHSVVVLPLTTPEEAPRGSVLSEVQTALPAEPAAHSVSSDLDGALIEITPPESPPATMEGAAGKRAEREPPRDAAGAVDVDALQSSSGTGASNESGAVQLPGNENPVAETLRVLSGIVDVRTPEPSVDRAPTPTLAPQGDAASSRLAITPRLIESIGLGTAAGRVGIPHLARIVVSTMLQTRERAPICILLPSTKYVAQFAAILAALECVSTDFKELKDQFIEKLLPGTRVRILPEGYVFVVGQRERVHGVDGVFLRYTERETADLNGKRLVRLDDLYRYEPTTRQLPKSRSSINFSNPMLTYVDKLAGVRTFGNSALYRNRIALVGTRSEFERALALTSLAPADGARAQPFHEASPLSAFTWGAFDENGRPFVISPSGSGGDPLVALARDLLDLEKACLDPSIKPWSRVVLTDRLDLVLKSLNLASQVGERQRIIVLADARRREDVAPLCQNGWRVWEPSPYELMSPEKLVSATVKTGLPGIDCTARSARAELDPSVEYLEIQSIELGDAYSFFVQLGKLLSSEAAADDSRIETSLDAVRSLFFGAASWLSLPDHERLGSYLLLIQQLKSEIDYIARYLGSETASALNKFVESIQRFVATCRDAGCTPKANTLWGVAAGSTQVTPVFVTGSRQSCAEADDLLAKAGIDDRCRLTSELATAEDFPAVIAFSLIRREAFERLMDPWPSQSIRFVGYGFEIDKYRKRIQLRGSQKAASQIDPDARTALTGLPDSAFSIPTVTAPAAVPTAPDDDELKDFDRIVDSQWHWRRAISIPRVDAGDVPCSATIVRFVGRSWMPMTDDHRPVCLIAAENDRRRSTIDHLDVHELRPGVRIIVREGGEKDVIRAIAQQLCGKDRYEMLRQRASLWRDAVRSDGSDPWRVARRLEANGIRRHIATIRMWLNDETLIGPRSADDVVAISAAFPMPGKTDADWKACGDAISELRALHLSAGANLTDQLVARCGRLLFEPAESETAVEFELGTVWIVEVAEIENSPRECPGSIVNRLQWLDLAWRDRVLGERLRVQAA